MTQQTCSCSNNRAYAICDEAGLIYRFTFSKDVATHILTYYPTYHITEYNIIVGDVLKPGEKGNGCYGIVSKKTGKLLRVTLIHEMAEFLTQDEHRYITECFIE